MEQEELNWHLQHRWAKVVENLENNLLGLFESLGKIRDKHIIDQFFKSNVLTRENNHIKQKHNLVSVQFSSVTQLCPTLCDPMNCSTPGLPIHHQLPEFTQTHVHRVSDAIQPSHPLSSPSPPAPNHSQHQGLFQWVNSLHEVAKLLEFQLQHHSFQWTPRTDLL